MTGFETFALFGAVALAAPSAASEREDELGITATVVRPAQISTAMTRPNVALLTLENSPGVEVLAEPEMVSQANGYVLVTIPVHTRAITITLTY